MYLKKHLLPWGLDQCHSECGIIIYSGDCRPDFKQSCWINSNMILLVGARKLHFSRKMNGDCWRVVYLCFKDGASLRFHSSRMQNLREVVEVKRILREMKGKEGIAGKCRDALILIRRVYKTQKKIEDIYYTS